MTRFLFACALAVSANLAWAEDPPAARSGVRDSGIRVGHSGSRSIVVYDNTRDSVGIWGYDLPNLNVAMGDQLHMTAGGVLDEFSFAVAVYNNTAPLLGVDATIWLGSVSEPTTWLYQLTAQPAFPTGIPANSYAVVTLSDLAQFNYILPQDVIVAVTYANPIGQADGNIGQADFGPPVTGTSDDYILYGYPDGLPLLQYTWPDFSPNNNMYYRIAVVGTAPPCRGDCSCDGLINFDDINAFVAVLSGELPWCPDNCDVNGDGSIDFADINPFVALLSGGGGPCP